MALSRHDVEHVSLLARLRLSDDELETMTAQLADIVKYIEQLDQLDTTDVEPMAHAVEFFNVLVDDVPQDSLPREAALMNAPKRDDECYRVPAVLGD